MAKSFKFMPTFLKKTSKADKERIKKNGAGGFILAYYKS